MCAVDQVSFRFLSRHLCLDPSMSAGQLLPDPLNVVLDVGPPHHVAHTLQVSLVLDVGCVLVEDLDEPVRDVFQAASITLLKME